jgi:uncharacterized membrane protein
LPEVAGSGRLARVAGVASIFEPMDWAALAVFVASWAGFSWLVDFSPWRGRTLTAAMNRERRIWMEMLADREVRIIDTAIVAGLQNGTAFFASTSLLAIGAAFAFLTTSDQVFNAVGALPFPVNASRAAWEAKAIGLLAIYAYAFFKFGWAYRLFNYTSILVGAVPPATHRDREEIRRAVARAVHMNILAGLSFSRGQRAFFFSVGFLGWFAGPWVFLAITLIVVAALCRRQFAFPNLALIRRD